jgi:TldD protein
MDDEGHTPHKTQLIKDGVCVNYLVDSFNGRRMNMKENGASRRESYQFEPTSRMSNTYIDNGTSTKEEIIAATKLGLYAVAFNGGQVDPSTGDFNFGVSEAYIIRDGKICEPVRGAMLIGKGHEILFNIDMVANDLDLCDGMCGSSSGSVPVQVGQPTLRIKEILVGGKGGALK